MSLKRVSAYQTSDGQTFSDGLLANNREFEWLNFSERICVKLFFSEKRQTTDFAGIDSWEKPIWWISIDKIRIIEIRILKHFVNNKIT